MRTVLLIVLLATNRLPAAAAEESLLFIDGFELSCNGGWELYMEDEAQRYFEMRHPDGPDLEGWVVYQEQDTWMGIKDLILFYSRLWIADLQDDREDETIAISTDTRPNGLSGYWLYRQTDSIATVLFAADIRRSPGFAVTILLTPIDIHAPLKEQEAMLLDILTFLSVEFFEAAG